MTGNEGDYEDEAVYCGDEFPSRSSVVSNNKNKYKYKVAVLIAAMVVIAAVVVPLSCVLLLPSKEKSTTSEEVRELVELSGDPGARDLSPTLQVTTNTLSATQQRGYVMCGVGDNLPGRTAINNQTGELEGFNVDLCRAVAAAALGDASKVEYTIVTAVNRWETLNNGSIDVLSRIDSLTMERDVYEPTSGGSFTFSVPYIYSGMIFGGRPPYVECVDTNNFTNCSDGITICVVNGTTYVATLNTLFHDSIGTLITLSYAASPSGCYAQLTDGSASVYAGNQFDLDENLVRQAGYTGVFVIGKNVFSRELLALVTRDSDPSWSDFVNWVLQSLLTAEEMGFTQANANHSFATTDLFGPNTTNMFVNALAAVGNYGEMYARNLEVIFPRSVMNQINRGSTGLIYSFPFGTLTTQGPGPVPGGTMERVLQRGTLNCGSSLRAIFAIVNTVTHQWSGFDVDFCRAVAAALFQGDATKVRFTNIGATERFQALQNGSIDVLSRITTDTFERDVNESTTGVGFSFSQPDFYDGLVFGGKPPFEQCAENRNYKSKICRKLSICVNMGTTYIPILYKMFPARMIVQKPLPYQVAHGLATGECNVVAGGASDVAVAQIRGVGGYRGPYVIGPKRFSKDPLAMVTRQDDAQWSSFVYWIVQGIFYADEQNITQATAETMPNSSVFSPGFARLFRDSVGAVGSYAEIYERNAQADVPRAGLNLLNAHPVGPELYPLPGLPIL